MKSMLLYSCYQNVLEEVDAFYGYSNSYQWMKFLINE